jgi:hypothetical protein
MRRARSNKRCQLLLIKPRLALLIGIRLGKKERSLPEVRPDLNMESIRQGECRQLHSRTAEHFVSHNPTNTFQIVAECLTLPLLEDSFRLFKKKAHCRGLFFLEPG